MADPTAGPGYEELARQALARLFGDGHVPLLVDGGTRQGVGEFGIEDPSSGSPVLVGSSAGASDIDAAVRSAHATLGAWRDAPQFRARALADAGRRIEQHELPLALIETLETGKPVSQSLADVRAAARYFAYYGGLVESVVGATIPLDASQHAYTLREPYGVTVHIIPWNSPVSQFARGVAPALGAGNTAVVKTSQRAPASVLAAARLMIDAGVPAGVCNVLSGPGAQVGIELIQHPLTALVVFTGSTETGRAVLAAAADGITPCKLELGGKSADLVFADADLGLAVQGAVASLTRNAGQSCYASTRLVVEDAVYDRFMDLVVDAIGQVKIGPGLLDLEMGPLSSAGHLAASVAAVRSAADAGARILAGGGVAAGPSAEHGGHFMEPTLVDSAAPDSAVAQRELFAPILAAFRFHDEAEAIALANGTDYGLAAGLYTQRHERVIRVARALEAGQVHVNRPSYAGVELPFGGYRSSGIGHEKGIVAIEEYARHKSVVSRA